MFKNWKIVIMFVVTLPSNFYEIILLTLVRIVDIKNVYICDGLKSHLRAAAVGASKLLNSRDLMFILVVIHMKIMNVNNFVTQK